MPLLLFLVILPIVEMWVLIKVGSHIGALPTIGLVFLAGILGLVLLRKQGASVLMRANQRMQRGEVPAREMVDGMFLAVGGILLLIPGFVTDAVALICLLPGIRYWLIGKSLKSAAFQAHTVSGSFGWGTSKRNDGAGDIIEGEFRRQPTPHDTPQDGSPAEPKRLPDDR